MSLEPDLTAPTHLASMLDALRRREPIFHHPEFGTTRADYAHMTVDDYWEIGASGQRTAANTCSTCWKRAALAAGRVDTPHAASTRYA